MKERSYLSDMLPFHLEVLFVVRDVGSLGPALLFCLSLTDNVLFLHSAAVVVAFAVISVLLFCFGSLFFC